MSAVIARFPVEQVMSNDVAQVKIGAMRSYRYPMPDEIARSLDDWALRWFAERFVLIGWEPVKEGLIKSFKNGRVRHMVSSVKPHTIENGKRPIVEPLCSIETYPVWNWKADGTARKTPAVVLHPSQASYFRFCKKCEARLGKILRAE